MLTDYWTELAACLDNSQLHYFCLVFEMVLLVDCISVLTHRFVFCELVECIVFEISLAHPQLLWKKAISVPACNKVWGMTDYISYWWCTASCWLLIISNIIIIIQPIKSSAWTLQYSIFTMKLNSPSVDFVLWGRGGGGRGVFVLTQNCSHQINLLSCFWACLPNIHHCSN